MSYSTVKLLKSRLLLKMSSIVSIYLSTNISEALWVNNLKILRIKNVKFSEYYFYMYFYIIFIFLQA